MSVLDGLTEGEGRAAVDLAQRVLGRLALAVQSGKLPWGGDTELLPAEALAIARWHAFRFARMGEALPGADDPLELHSELRPVDGMGRVFRGDTTLTDDTLEKVQAAVIAKVDAKAAAKITEGPGFEYPASSGNRFSLSLTAQAKWNGLQTTRASLTYPYTVPTADDQTYYAIPDASTVAAMYEVAMGVILSELAAANAVKAEVIAADTATDARAAATAYLAG